MTIVNMGEENFASFRVLFAGDFEGNDVNEEPAQFYQWN
jgi:hypothetical protein